ncbi:hypothetical protein D3C72_2398260 [compost metagenome]
MKAGDSFIFRRIQTDTPSSSAERRNGMRQPQSAKASLPISVWMPRMISSERKRPRVAVVWIHEV